MKISTIHIVLLMLIGLPLFVQARVWTIGPKQNIQKTIDAATDGDTIRILKGIYKVNNIQINKYQKEQ